MSSDGVVARDLPDTAVVKATGADLRTGGWTRLGSSGVLGDGVTEGILGGLAERSQQAARAQGYATGWAEGRRVALARAAEEALAVRRAAAADQERRDAEHARVLAALDTAVAAAQARLEAALAELAEAVVPLALQLAEAVIGREVLTATDPGGDALRRALSEVPAAAPVTVRLHPADHALLDPALLEQREVTVVADPLLARGDAVAETPDTVVDATLGTAMERVREVLAR
jgi:flagellar assembly protein FliH